MIIVDAHCDTALRLLEEDGSLLRNSYHLDLERMQGPYSRVQFFAAFIQPEFCGGEKGSRAMVRAVEIIDRFKSEADLYRDRLMHCRHYGEICEAISHKKVAAIISIEGGDALEGDLTALQLFYDAGVRSICLTWNYSNEIADGVGQEDKGRGLTVFGEAVVAEMNRLGMLVDLSHISEKSFWDVLKVTTKPVIASHSNAKKICGHRRNLSDPQILALKQNGGVMGLNLYPYFLTGSGEASMKDVIAHVEHICALSGHEHLGIGADFDGIERTPEGIGGVQELHLILDELLKLNYKESWVRAIAGGNFLRVIKTVM